MRYAELRKEAENFLNSLQEIFKGSPQNRIEKPLTNTFRTILYEIYRSKKLPPEQQVKNKFISYLIANRIRPKWIWKETMWNMISEKVDRLGLENVVKWMEAVILISEARRKHVIWMKEAHELGTKSESLIILTILQALFREGEENFLERIIDEMTWIKKSLVKGLPQKQRVLLEKKVNKYIQTLRSLNYDVSFIEDLINLGKKIHKKKEIPNVVLLLPVHLHQIIMGVILLQIAHLYMSISKQVLKLISLQLFLNGISHIRDGLTRYYALILHLPPNKILKNEYFIKPKKLSRDYQIIKDEVRIILPSFEKLQEKRNVSPLSHGLYPIDLKLLSVKGDDANLVTLIYNVLDKVISWTEEFYDLILHNNYESIKVDIDAEEEPLVKFFESIRDIKAILQDMKENMIKLLQIQKEVLNL